MKVEQMSADNERELRRWMAIRDLEFAVHRQLKDYFLAPTDSFGAAAIRDDTGQLLAVGFFSKFGGKAFVHHLMGQCSADIVEALRKWLALPCQAFFKTEQEAALGEPSAWDCVLRVTPGYVVDHPAYDGVFSRVAPRFNGGVYEHPGD